MSETLDYRIRLIQDKLIAAEGKIIELKQKQIENLEAEIAYLTEIINKKRIDSQRLDWLEAHDKEALEVFYSLTSGFDLRQLIDRLMKEPLHDQDGSHPD